MDSQLKDFGNSLILLNTMNNLNVFKQPLEKLWIVHIKWYPKLLLVWLSITGLVCTPSHCDQNFDGSVMIISHVVGLQTIMKSMYKNAHFVYYYRLNLTVRQAKPKDLSVLF